MKKFFKIFGITVLSLITVCYLSFLFVLPNVVDLNKYIPEVQKIAKDATGLNVEINDVKIVTTPLLGAGIQTGNINITLPDESTLFTADAVRARIALPSLALLTVKVSCLEVDSPNINMEIAEGKQFKLLTLIQDILNKNSDDKIASAEPQSEPIINPALIRIKVPAATLNNYNILINDLKAGHTLALKGEKFIAGYFNGKTLKLKTDAKVLSDESENITANIQINTFLPPPTKLDEEDDKAQRVELPFVNPVEMYRTYDLKSNLDTKLKIRQHKGNIALKGHLNIDNTTMTLSGYTLPECYLHYLFKGSYVEMDNNLYVAKGQNVNVKGRVKYTKRPAIDLAVKTDKIYIHNVLVLTKALLNTLQIPNELADVTAKGYFSADTAVKTNFKKLKSHGNIIARDGAITNNKTGIAFTDMNANISFDNNMLAIDDTGLKLNGEPLKLEGSIDEKSVVNLILHAEHLPLASLFTAFAPKEVKNAYNLSSGNLSLSAKISGQMKKATAELQTGISNFALAAKNNSFRLSDENLAAKFDYNFKTLSGKIVNKNFNFAIPQTNSVVTDEILTVDITDRDVILHPTDLKINGNSVINIKALIVDYTKNPIMDIFVDGKLNALDLKQLAGEQAGIFLDAKGTLPLKLSFKGNSKRQNLIFQLFADKDNYFTPVHFNQLANQQSVFQAKVDFKGDRLKVKETGLYTNIEPVTVTNDLDMNLGIHKEFAKVNGTISGLNGAIQNINLFHVNLKDLDGSLYAFKDSTLKVGGSLFVFGDSTNPRMRGTFLLKNLSIPTLYLTLDELGAKIKGHNLNVNMDNLVLNGSDLNAKLHARIPQATPIFTIGNLDVTSNLINVENIMKVSEAAMKIVPPSPTPAKTTVPADIPVELRDGSINMRRIVSGNIVAENTTGRISLNKNVFSLNNLRTIAIGGDVTGDISANILSMALKIAVQGKNFDVEKTLLTLANMKDMLSGTLAFDTDISLAGTTMEEQMASLKGDVNFKLEDGTLGPFGKIENFILAENIRESQFFQTALGGMLDSLTSIDTAHYDTLTGHIGFNDGVAMIDPITSIGGVLSLNLAGDMNLLENKIDMKVRARLASQISDMLGPISNLNPINLVKATPGLNVAAAQMFKLFCETVTQAEMDAVPSLGESDDNATKFQIVLRGDVAKPLTLVKSFKWLALDSDVENASSFVSSLPDPSVMENPENATLEQIMQKQAELQAIEDAKPMNRIKRLLNIDKSEEEGAI